jgi:sugar phosphate isomerase/epimerase
MGDTDWRQIFTILYANQYEGMLSIEGYHDPWFAGEWEMTGQLHALRYLKWARGGEFTPNPWA